VQLLSIENLQRVTKIPLRFDDFQNIILGKPVINDNDILYGVNKDSVTAKVTGEALQYFYTFNKQSLLLQKSNFKTNNNTTVSSADIRYIGYETNKGYTFSTARDINVSGTSPASLQLNFKEYNFNEPQSFVFTISKNYTVKYE
jgi:hypothetical protein